MTAPNLKVVLSVVLIAGATVCLGCAAFGALMQLWLPRANLGYGYAFKVCGTIASAKIVGGVTPVVDYSSNNTNCVFLPWHPAVPPPSGHFEFPP
ncbi:MAG: hypothetical protein FJ030_17210 [Chloroflexi bacterium]|nr:hypothetical protein [Chloroflexota bacterium]